MAGGAESCRPPRMFVPLPVEIVYEVVALQREVVNDQLVVVGVKHDGVIKDCVYRLVLHQREDLVINTGTFGGVHGSDSVLEPLLHLVIIPAD